LVNEFKCYLSLLNLTSLFLVILLLFSSVLNALSSIKNTVNGLSIFNADFSHAGGSEGTLREITGLLDRDAECDRNCIESVLEEAMNCFSKVHRQRSCVCGWKS
jgi:hypothetical protein